MSIQKAREANLVDETVGFALRRLRRAKSISQKELAVYIGVSYQQIQKYEQGVNRISASRLWQFCQVLDIEPGYFFQGLYISAGIEPAVAA